MGMVSGILPVVGVPLPFGCSFDERRSDMRARLGAPQAMTATAHKLARLVYSMLRYGTAYVDAGQQAYAQQYRAGVLTHLQRQARVFGYQLVHVADPGSAQAAATL